MPELAKLADDLVGKGLLGIEPAGHRSNARAGELADGVAQQAVLVGEVKVHGVQLYRANVLKTTP